MAADTPLEELIKRPLYGKKWISLVPELSLLFINSIVIDGLLTHYYIQSVQSSTGTSLDADHKA